MRTRTPPREPGPLRARIRWVPLIVGRIVLQDALHHALAHARSRKTLVGNHNLKLLCVKPRTVAAPIRLPTGFPAHGDHLTLPHPHR